MSVFVSESATYQWTENVTLTAVVVEEQIHEDEKEKQEKRKGKKKQEKKKKKNNNRGILNILTSIHKELLIKMFIKLLLKYMYITGYSKCNNIMSHANVFNHYHRIKML